MKFASEELQRCFNNAEPVLNTIKETKDLVSNDIKNFEKYLKSIKLPQSFEYVVTPITIYEENFEEDIGTYIQERLVWNHELQRLIYHRTLYHVPYNPDDRHYSEYDPTGFQSQHEVIIEKPLIETTFDIRKKIIEESHLVGLLSLITKNYDVYKKFESNSS